MVKNAIHYWAIGRTKSQPKQKILHVSTITHNFIPRSTTPPALINIHDDNPLCQPLKISFKISIETNSLVPHGLDFTIYPFCVNP